MDSISFKELAIATLETLYMGFGSTILAYLLGLPLGVILTLTDKNGLTPKPKVYALLSFLVNLLRSVPFLILLLAVIPLTRAVVGTTIGSTATIVPLVIAAVPMIGQVTAAAFADVDGGVIEAAKAQGATPFQIVRLVLIPEAKPSLIRDGVITSTTIIGYSAMAGIVAGGGLGDLAIRFGYYRYEASVMLISVAILVAIIQITGSAGVRFAQKIDKR